MTIGQKRKQQILKESIELIKVDGLEGLTMRKVAKRVGITEASAYRYFPHKRDLLLGIITSMSSQLLQPIRDMRDSDKPAEERLQQMVTHHIEFVMKEDGLPLIFLTEVAGSRQLELADKIQEIISEIHRIFQETIRELLPKDVPISSAVLQLVSPVIVSSVSQSLSLFEP